MRTRFLLLALIFVSSVACNGQKMTPAEAAKLDAALSQSDDKSKDNTAEEVKEEDKPAKTEENAGEADTEKEVGDRNPALTNPALANETAPATYKLKFATTKGDFTVDVTREWAPNGADRLYNLAKIGYFDDVAFFRVIQGFMVQFGIHGDGEVNKKWREARIADDEVKQTNGPGYVTFATAGPNTRTSQLFINFGNNQNLDNQGFAPLGKISEGMDVVNSIYGGYGEGAPNGRGPDQGRMQEQGNTYLKASFPKLDYIKHVTIVE